MAPQTEEDKSSGLVLTILTCCLGLICGKPEDETPHTPAQATEQTTADTHTITSAPEPQINTQTHAHEQVSSENVVPTADELGDLSAACNRLWGLDINRLLPGSEYKINVQGGKKVCTGI
ncbi:hypothetical protein SARC_13675 [Sphaeroforma arctica JP610]|uniref:EndoU domain-containing protein n=1 Tax=Sphaeroforma arctica JP610 TaxID=667725 RepID=A0A0L0FAM5_9EUKA|nr:hypothetical protein SARC_13675 [Sphaeroforma arctica JP610]KNC73767.1 hypothetical protein SARC_13675 [Sphaeroforma arctica JP610]|eukprot:XP_014147669.1 hypothetical protein SARC_13675 [Sphaeroforma arctica JP610]